MKLSDTKSNRLVVLQAKIFLVLMLVIFAIANSYAAMVFFANNFGQDFLDWLLKLNLLILAVFVFGELLLFGGLFWWEKIKFEAD